MVKKGNIYSALPAAVKSEVFENILLRKGLRIERITSKGQATASGRWLKQNRPEWAILLKGRARLKFKSTGKVYIMRPGDYVFIPRQVEHRVEWTARGQKTIWLAVHYKGETIRTAKKGSIITSVPWFIYIVKCSDKSLYTGITTNIARRVKEHNSKKGAFYTQNKTPVKLVYQEPVFSRSQALKREFQIKRLPRAKKLALIKVQ